VTTWRWERLLPLTGPLAVAFWIVALVIEDSANRPDEDAPAGRWLLYFKAETNTIITAGFLFIVGALLFFLFLGVLRDRLHTAEGGAGRWTAVSYASGVATSIFLISMVVPSMSGAFHDDDIAGATGQAYGLIGDGFFFAAELTGALFLLATGLVALRTRVLSTWLAWVSVAIGIVMLIPPIGWAGLVWGLPAWLIVVGGMLFWGARTTTSTSAARA
jgi:hypothetical protein